MRKLLQLLLGLVLLAGCSRELPDPEILMTSTQTTYSLGYKKGDAVTLDFTANGAWTATAATGLDLSATAGKKGASALTVKARETNNTNEAKKYTLTLSCTSGEQTATQTVTLEQKPAFELETTEYKVSAEGGTVKISFTYNGSGNYSYGNRPPLALYYDNVNGPLMLASDCRELQTGNTRSVELYYNLSINPNTSVNDRTCSLWIAEIDESQPESSDDFVVAYSTEIVVAQSGLDKGDTDYSQDGKVTTLQTHTKGAGIPIVILGDGFLDTHIADGTFDKAVQKAYGYLFTVEPVKSLKEYFDVYSVAAVSRDSYFTSSSSTAFSLQFEGGSSTGIDGDTERILKYAQKVDGISSLGMGTSYFRFRNLLVIVLANVDKYAGTTLIGVGDAVCGAPTGYSIAYVPMCDPDTHDGMGMEQLLHHEALGHGFGKLADEYSYEDNGTLEGSELTSLESLYTQYFYMNTDTESDVTQSHWARLAADSSFSSEKLSCYEGAYTYVKGVYRPTENSIMLDNTGSFNAPSREAIYKRAMMLAAGGSNYTYDYDAFVKFDQTFRNSQQTRVTSGTRSKLPRLASPRLIWLR